MQKKGRLKRFFFLISQEKRNKKTNAIIMNFYVIFCTDTNYTVRKKDSAEFYYNHIWILLSFLVRYSKERLKRPAAATKTDHSRLNCRLCRDRPVPALHPDPYRWWWSIRVKSSVKTKKCPGNLMVKKIWKLAGNNFNYDRVNTTLWMPRFLHWKIPLQPATSSS